MLYTGDRKKLCSRCSNFRCLINQGYWWCNKDNTENMDAESCSDYNDAFEGVTMTTSSSYTGDNPTYYEDAHKINPIAKYRLIRAKQRRKKQRGIKHGRN